jgi:hypothetical protein
MNGQFDKTLRDHIRDTFDHFDDQMAGDGWEKFNKQKNRRRRAVIFWYALPTSIAAALALLWMVNIYDFHTQENNSQIAAKTEIRKNNAPKKIKEGLDQNLIAQSSSKSNNKQAKENQPWLSSNNQKEHLSDLDKKGTKDFKTTPKKLGNLSNESLALVLKDLNQKEEKVNQQKEEEFKIQNFNEILADHPETITITQFDHREISKSISKTDRISVKEKGIALASAVLKQPKALLYSTYIKTAEPILTGRKKRLKVSIDATTYVNFSENGINDQVNLGLGLTSEYPLGKHMSVNSGLSFNRQTSSFDGNNRTASDFKFASFSNVAAIPKAQISNAKLVGIDIPLNLKYSLKVGKSNAFITTGFSAYALINERYTNDFSVINYGVTGVKTSNVRTVQDNPEGAFAYFKFARTLNFSFGVKYPLSKKSSISLEPFIKYPLSGLGYQDLKIGSGGISFKLNLGK